MGLKLEGSSDILRVKEPKDRSYLIPEDGKLWGQGWKSAFYISHGFTSAG